MHRLKITTSICVPNSVGHSVGWAQLVTLVWVDEVAAGGSRMASSASLAVSAQVQSDLSPVTSPLQRG